MHPIRRRDTPSDRVYRDGTGVARRIGCSASCSEPGGYFEVVWLRLMLPLVCVGRKCPRLGLLREAVHPIRRHDTPSDRVYRDGSGVSRRNGCSAYHVQYSPHPRASRSYVRQRRSRTSPEDNKQGRGPSLAARTPPYVVSARLYLRVSAATTGVYISSAARSITGQLRVNPECRQRAAQRRLPPHSPPLRRRMRLRARGARDEAEPAEPAEPAAPPSAPPEHGSATLPHVANAARASFQATGVRRHRDHAEGGERHWFHHIACYRRGVTPDREESTPSDRLESSRSGGILSAVQAR